MANVRSAITMTAPEVEEFVRDGTAEIIENTDASREYLRAVGAA